MHRIEDFLVFPAILASDDVFMPNNATVQPVTLEVEPVNPCVRVDHQTFIPSVIEMIPKESSQGMLRQLILKAKTLQNQQLQGFALPSALSAFGVLGVYFGVYSA